ncbi:MAG: chemotaxis protein CheW [Lachnospiraceae bacterium]|nr:chemotaxis protein CheW [Lachnospiraceae bacterium]MBO7096255.1 chemotaxis protein CheW [Lachnospiraceae bacterium]MBO7363515.1 chemotaxis protein CheW [Lachnospiraceae bacterium]MBO7530690.1 chemotaxis protein CheW [Lachnospiraceae bacterium]MBP5471378.1 chemotaxis protein CheW [Lachnospiraceae bacterium]
MELSNDLKNLPASGDETKIVKEIFQYIVISLGDEDFGIDINYIDNILRMQQITRVPKVPAYLKGVINLRGEVIPVMSLRLKMGLSEDEIGRDTRIIILKVESEGSIGVLVDEVKEVIKLSEDQIESTTPEGGTPEARKFVSAVGKNGDQLISILDIGTINLDDI